MATSVWTWTGRFFGTIDNGNLWTYDGRHVGKLKGDEIYDRYGHYLGEIRDKRLITALHKCTKLGDPFTPQASRVRVIPHVEYVAYAMYAGYEDFPSPDEL